jgi:NADPH:quinone reductase-like Zn-dependent oxidoreductase
MQAASLNFRDTVMARRGYGRRSGNLPLVLCSDGAGVIEEVGAGVTRVRKGDLVCPIFSQNWLDGTFREEHWAATLGGPLDGTMQEFLCLSQEGVVKAPAHMSAADAATLPCAAVTAWNALVEQGHVKAGDIVLVQGTGGVSLFALLFAKMHGALAIVTSSSDEKLARAKALGADHGINYRSTPDWAKPAREISGGRGVDHVVEVGGAATLEQSIRAIRPSGVISLIGVLSGAAGQVNLGPVVTQNVRLQGVTVGSRTMFENMNRALERHRVQPPIDDKRYRLEEFRAALEAFPQGRHFGKVVVDF